MLLITTFVELRLVAGRRRTRAGRPHAAYGRPMLIHTCHSMPILRCAVALRCRFQKGIVGAWHGCGKACVNQTRPYCINQIGKKHFKPLASRHGMSAACKRHGMCEIAFNLHNYGECWPSALASSKCTRK
jgi:hypothetical protein